MLKIDFFDVVAIYCESYAVITVLELLAVVAIIVGFIIEPQIADWEQRTWEKCEAKIASFIAHRIVKSKKGKSK